MLWSFSSSLPISSPRTVFFAVPCMLPFLSCVENEWDGKPPPVVPATFVLFEAHSRSCWGILNLSSCADAYPFLPFDWWAAIIHAIPVFITKLWSFLLSHLEWLYVWLCAFLIASFPCDQLHQHLDFLTYFSFNLKILPPHWIFVSSKINLSLAFRYTFWVSSLYASVAQQSTFFTTENEIPTVKSVEQTIMQTQFLKADWKPL